MPVHDWTRAPAGLFHHFHQGWITALSNHLNAGNLPDGYFALAEQVTGGSIPDVLTLQSEPESLAPDDLDGGLSVVTSAPRTRFVQQAELDAYARKASRIAVRHPFGHVVAVLEIVSPGNKASRAALRAFVEKANDFLRQGVHLLIVDLLPSTKRDPGGIHKAVWDELADEPVELPPDKPLTLAAYSAGPVRTAYVEPVAVGDALPDMPLFLSANGHVLVPLEATYQATWRACPARLRAAVEGA